MIDTSQRLEIRGSPGRMIGPAGIGAGGLAVTAQGLAISHNELVAASRAYAARFGALAARRARVVRAATVAMGAASTPAPRPAAAPRP
jgi:hypothetical protein